MKDVLIGRYQLGYRMVNLYGLPDSYGGSFNVCIDQKDPFMKIGLLDKNFEFTFSVLFHEAIEMALQEVGCTFKPMCFEEGASDVRHFYYNHNQHTEVCARASYFIHLCQDDLKKAHAKAHKTRK